MAFLEMRIPQALAPSARLQRSVEDVAGARALVRWQQHPVPRINYGASDHHTLSFYVEGGWGVRPAHSDTHGEPGVICVMPAEHETTWSNGETMSMLHLYVDHARLEEQMGGTLSAPRPVVFGRDDMIEAVVRNVILPLDWQAPADRLLLDHAVLLVMARLCRDLKAERASGLTPKQYRRIEEIMHAEPDGDHSLARLAGAVGLSPRHFLRSYRKATGLSPGERLRHIRIERSKALIADGVPLAEVALASGFSSQSHMTARFKAETGMTPAAYRRSLRR